MTTIAIVANGIVKMYGTRTAVDNLDLAIPSGVIFGILGPNGAGKSTIVRMISGMCFPTSGQLAVLGRDPSVDGRSVRSRVGIVPQADTLDADLSVRDNLIYYGGLFGVRRKELRRRTDGLLAFAQLSDRSSSRISELSGGMRRRLSLARALVNQPEMLLLDEPTTGLDPQARHLVWDRLRGLRDEGLTQVLTTHFMDEAETLCDELVVLDQGRVIARGTPAELVRQNGGSEILEIRFARPDLGNAARSIGDLFPSSEVAGDTVIVASDAAAAIARQLGRRGLLGLSHTVRKATLEDAFLRLTGRALAD